MHMPICQIDVLNNKINKMYFACISCTNIVKSLKENHWIKILYILKDVTLSIAVTL